MTGNGNYNYNSCLKPIRLTRINKPDKIKQCLECKVNSHSAGCGQSTLESKLNVHTMNDLASSLLDKFSHF